VTAFPATSASTGATWPAESVAFCGKVLRVTRASAGPSPWPSPTGEGALLEATAHAGSRAQPRVLRGRRWLAAKRAADSLRLTCATPAGERDCIAHCSTIDYPSYAPVPSRCRVETATPPRLTAANKCNY
jgi:hypothetical protein